jgi:hypothetical protein
MILLAAHRWQLGALVRERGDTTAFSSLLVVGHQSNGRVLTVSLAPPPWATPAERGVRSSRRSDLVCCDPPTS